MKVKTKLKPFLSESWKKDIKEDEQQRHDTVLGHREEEPVALKEILKLHHEVAADIELKIRNENNNFKKCYYNFLRTYRKIVTKCHGQSPVASLASAFVHFGKQQSSNLIPVLHNGSRIRVQPTSISHRKSGEKSSSAQPPGPKPRLQTGVKRKWQANDKESLNIRKLAKKKRQHNLSMNIKKNIANAGEKHCKCWSKTMTSSNNQAY